MSVSMRGPKLGTGPRGHYVRVGGGDIRYCQTVRCAGEKLVLPTNKPVADDIAEFSSTTYGLLEEIESDDVLEMRNINADEILNEINRTEPPIAQWISTVFLANFIILLALISDSPQTLTPLATLISVLVIIGMYNWAKEKRTIVLLYDLDATSTQLFNHFLETFQEIAKAERKWHVSRQGTVFNRKYHAGAGRVVDRNPIALSEVPPTCIRTNIPIPSIPVGKQVLCFFPDHLLVFERGRAGSLLYQDLHVKVSGSYFVEDELPPVDSQQVGRTWKYVNKNCGPDRRFNNNRELPIMAYEEIYFQSENGLNECIQVSLVGASDGLPSALKKLASVEKKLIG